MASYKREGIADMPLVGEPYDWEGIPDMTLAAGETYDWEGIPDLAVKKTLEIVKKMAPTEYAQLEANPAMKEELIAAAKEAASEEVKLAYELKDEPDDIAAVLCKHLSNDRMKILKGGLEIPTFRMSITKEGDGPHKVTMMRDNEEMFSSIFLDTAAQIDTSALMQYGSIIVEGVLLVVSAVGISLSPGKKVIAKAVKETVQVIRKSSQFRRAIQTFLKAWNKAGASKFSKAKALFFLVKDTYSAGLLWTILKSICSNMKWYDWVKTAAKVTAMIIAAFATGGAALIAKIALVVLDSVDFAKKIVNLNTMYEIEKTF
eukprot:Seg3189.1 transcript_id=Seg3189.1/GoldUCD/mRNA.D3Y31 product="hypothetical protein" protein_id=Seg3189.1/GoldUCD/D3Y31